MVIFKKIFSAKPHFTKFYIIIELTLKMLKQAILLKILFMIVKKIKFKKKFFVNNSKIKEQTLHTKAL